MPAARGMGAARGRGSKGNCNLLSKIDNEMGLYSFAYKIPATKFARKAPWSSLFKSMMIFIHFRENYLSGDVRHEYTQ